MVSRYRLNSSRRRLRTVMESGKHGNKATGSIKDGEFLDKLSDQYLVKEDCPPQKQGDSLCRSVGS
jgi:hypothetical protein